MNRILLTKAATIMRLITALAEEKEQLVRLEPHIQLVERYLADPTKQTFTYRVPEEKLAHQQLREFLYHHLQEARRTLETVNPIFVDKEGVNKMINARMEAHQFIGNIYCERRARIEGDFFVVGAYNLKQFIEKYDEGFFDQEDKDDLNMVDAGWADWHCKDHALPGRTKRLMGIVRAIASAPALDPEEHRIYFKNSAPTSGGTYDAIGIIRVEDDEQIFWVAPNHRGNAEVMMGPDFNYNLLSDREHELGTGAYGIKNFFKKLTDHEMGLIQEILEIKKMLAENK